MKRTPEGAAEGVGEALESEASLAMTVTCWLQSNRICEVLLIDEMVQVVDRNFVEVVYPQLDRGEGRLGRFDEERQGHYQARDSRSRADYPKKEVRKVLPLT
jgi:hypothetical protein